MRGGLKRAIDERLCPPETVGVGLYGRAGLYVDRLGIVCAQAPGAAPPMVLPPPRPAPAPAPAPRIVPPRSDTVTDPHHRLRRPVP